MTGSSFVITASLGYVVLFVCFVDSSGGTHAFSDTGYDL